jgi:prepilin-type N-terminal cleavage/methylation domain-containing protein
MKNDKKQQKAFTLIELLAVLAILAVLAAIRLPALAASERNAQKVTCINNLKQIGIAIRIWEGANGDKYPMQVPASQGGAQDYLQHCNNNTDNQLTTDISLCPGETFMVMSNQLSSSKILNCPADAIHIAATNWSYRNVLNINYGGAGNLPAQGIARSTISYFVGADATEADPQSIISGDGNIGNAGNSSTAGASSYWASSNTTTRQIDSVAFGASFYWGWTVNDLHQKTGNLLIADGSVQSVTESGLHTALNNATNAVPYPAVNFSY